jgi:phage shock protein PspC (stress-responsive transcriptional regulator)
MDLFDNIGDVFEGVGDFFTALLDPQTYVRIFYVLFGALLIWGAVTYGR